MRTLLAIAMLALPFGCSTPPLVDNPAPITAEDYDRAYEESIETLRAYGFVIDRQDHRFGTVTARPAGAPTIVEPWIPTHSDLDQSVANTLHDERRQITIRLEPASEDAADTSDPYQIRAEVMIERRSVPVAYVTGSTAGTRMMRTLRGMPAPWKDRGIAPTYWRPLRRDPTLETHLVSAIVRTMQNADPISPSP